MKLDVTREFFDDSFRVKPGETIDEVNGQALIDQGVAIEHVDPPADPNRVPESNHIIDPSGTGDLVATTRKEIGNDKGNCSGTSETTSNG